MMHRMIHGIQSGSRARTIGFLCLLLPITLAAGAGIGAADDPPKMILKTERFDGDPGWDGHNNRLAVPKNSRTVKQDFGFSPTNHAGKGKGEIGGFISAAGEPAYYAKVLPTKTFDDVLTASGTLNISDGVTHLLLGFFNADSSTNEWRGPNTIAIRLNGRGTHFFAYTEYCTSKWRAGADFRQQMFKSMAPRDPEHAKKVAASWGGFLSGGKTYKWSIKYDPAGNNGGGTITATLGGDTSVCNLTKGHQADGATFNRFGILNVLKSHDGGTNVFFDDITINGVADSFDKDPQWDARDNRRTYQSGYVRPLFDFGYSNTQFAGGKGKGEMGGPQIFRGDCRYPERMAFYGDKIGPLKLDKPLKASGKVAFRRGVSDSTTLFGFFHSKDSMRENPSQNDGTPESVIGIHIEGGSAEGFNFYPVSRMKGGQTSGARGRAKAPRIFPDGKSHDWTLDYDPLGSDGNGRITITLDGNPVNMDLKAGEKTDATAFDRFGIVTTWIDGNGQSVYFDDLTYTTGFQKR